MARARDGLLTISQAAARLRVHPQTLRAWADRGLVPVVKLPSGYRRFRPDELDRVAREMGLEREDESGPAAGAGADSRTSESLNAGSTGDEDTEV